MILEVWYKKNWGRFHIAIGILFSIIFLLGAFALKDYYYLTYLILSAGIIYMGYVRLKKPYLICTKDEICVTGIFGELARKYHYQKFKEITINENRFFKDGQKLKFNAWFTNEHHWENLKRLFKEEPLLVSELQD